MKILFINRANDDQKNMSASCRIDQTPGNLSFAALHTMSISPKRDVNKTFPS